MRVWLSCRAQERFWGHSEGGTVQRGRATVIHTKRKATVTASYLLHKHHICYLSHLANKSPPHIHTSMRMHTHTHKQQLGFFCFCKELAYEYAYFSLMLCCTRRRLWLHPVLTCGNLATKKTHTEGNKTECGSFIIIMLLLKQYFFWFWRKTFMSVKKGQICSFDNLWSSVNHWCSESFLFLVRH